MTNIDTMKLALDALELFGTDDMAYIKADKAIAALRQAISEAEQLAEEVKDNQNWKQLDGATAWHLIERHADNWAEVGAMMDAWLRANVEAAVIAEREACAKVCEELINEETCYVWIPDAKGAVNNCAAAIRARGEK